MPQRGVYVGNSHKSEPLYASLNAYKPLGPHDTEHHEWPNINLSVGDRVSIQVEESGEPSTPPKTRRFSTESNNRKLEESVAKLIAEARLSGHGPGALDPKMAEKTDYYCSFCSKHSTEVETLISGPSVNICSECVAKCQEVLERQKS